MTTVAIVGGGFTGATVAYHLARQVDPRRVRIVVYEPRPALGHGLAYGTVDPAHRINVPAAKMSLLPDDDGHFARWIEVNNALAGDPAAVRPDGAAFPARSVFGAYVASELAPLIANGAVEHVHDRVSAIRRHGDGWHVHAATQARLAADIVVLATTHPAPVAPAALSPIAGLPGFVADSLAAGALDDVPPAARVLVVGAGLTAADIVASLRRRGHGGPITLLSRNGLRSRGHAPVSGLEPRGDFVSQPSRRAVDLLQRVRAEIARAAGEGVPWQTVFDALRIQGGAIWQALPIEERRRIVRHLRSFWDVHRFRIAPQLDELLNADLAAGRLRQIAGRLLAAEPGRDGGFSLKVRRRRAAATEDLEVDVVVVATGPAHGAVLETQPLLQGLAADGILTADAVGLGIACDEGARAIRRDGRPEASFFIAGPLARGTFGELMGLPQVTEQAAFVANTVAASIAGHRQRTATG